MALNFILFLVSFVISGCQAQNFYSCGSLSTMDCDVLPLEEVCATDGQTYKNKCAFGKMHCMWLDIHLKYEKACDPADFSTTPHPTAIVSTAASGGDVVLDIFCAYLPYKPCPAAGVITEYICGTDGRSYENFCEYEKARCTHRDLHVHSWGNCTS